MKCSKLRCNKKAEYIFQGNSLCPKHYRERNPYRYNMHHSKGINSETEAIITTTERIKKELEKRNKKYEDYNIAIKDVSNLAEIVENYADISYIKECISEWNVRFTSTKKIPFTIKGMEEEWKKNIHTKNSPKPKNYP